MKKIFVRLIRKRERDKKVTKVMSPRWAQYVTQYQEKKHTKLFTF